MIDHSSAEKSRRLNALATHVKMLFSCFGGGKAQAAAASTTMATTRSRATRQKARGLDSTNPCSRPEKGGKMAAAKAGDSDEVEAGRRMRRKKRKVVVVGDGECGKTCLLQRFCKDTYNLQGYLPTVFDTDVVDVQLDKTTVELMITDTAGQEDYDRLRPYSYPDTDVVIICFAIDNPDSLENVRLNWIPEIRYFCGSEVPVLLVGNKMDLRGHGEAETQHSTASSSDDFLDFPECSPSAALIKQGPVKESAARKLAEEVGAVGYWETSALLDQGVSEVFQSASRAALRRRRSGRKVRGKERCRRKRSFLERVGLKKARQM